MNKKYWVILSIATILTCSGWLFLHQRKTTPFKMEVISTPNGYGYEIFYLEERVITQETIPALPGFRAFPDSISAVKVGKLVVKKLNKMESPAVSAEELSALGIK